MDYKYFNKALDNLKQQLKDSDSVKFAYRKKDGDLRIALGTRNPEIIESHGATPKGTGSPGSADSITYYDLNSDAWRCFKEQNLIWTDEAGVLVDNLTEEESVNLEEMIVKTF